MLHLQATINNYTCLSLFSSDLIASPDTYILITEPSNNTDHDRFHPGTTFDAHALLF